MGIVLGKTLGRQVIEVTMADDLQKKVGAWCAARGLRPEAQAKIEKELQSRLDESLARAIQEQEGGGAAAAVPDDVC